TEERMMSDFVVWVRRMSVTLAVVVLAAGVSWADEPNNQGADDPLEAPQMEDQHDGDDNPGPNPGPGTGSRSATRRRAIRLRGIPPQIPVHRPSRSTTRAIRW